MTKLETKVKLEVLKVKIGINTKMVSEEVWKRTDSPHMHDYYANELKEDTKEYLELLREVLVPNKTYVMDMCNSIMLYDKDNNIVPFLYENMVQGGYQSGYDTYLFNIDTPFAINKYCNAGEGTMEENRAEIVECLYLSQWTFFVDDEGNTIINGRPDEYDDEEIYVKVNTNIFNTDLIMNISLVSI